MRPAAPQRGRKGFHQIRSLGIVFFFTIAGFSFGQQNGDPYRDAYRRWRALDPQLEKDAATAGATLGARADKVAAEAAQYLSAKKDYAEGRIAAAQTMASEFQPVTTLRQAPDMEKNIDLYLELQARAVDATIKVFGDDPDRGIQQLRQTLERERTALTALTDALKTERSAASMASDAGEKTERAREALVDHLDAFVASLKKTVEGTAEQTTSWPAYYRAVAESTRAALSSEINSSHTGPLSPAPIQPRSAQASSTRASSTEIALTQTQPNQTGPDPPASSDTSSEAASVRPPSETVHVVSPAIPSESASSRTAPPVPLSRYIGAWTYAKPSSIFLGAEPVFVDLVVHEEDGELSGTLYARFKVESGDPLIRFDFKGAIKPSRNQSFTLLTSDNATGSIELIPGPAFNLLEVNFHATPAAGKVRNGNFILLKK